MSPSVHFQCPMLNSTNYTTWAIRKQIILEANNLWEAIEPQPTTKDDVRRDKTATAYLYQSLPEDQLLLISKYKTAKEANLTEDVAMADLINHEVEGVTDSDQKERTGNPHKIVSNEKLLVIQRDLLLIRVKHNASNAKNMDIMQLNVQKRIKNRNTLISLKKT
ncbi:hypothetical protein L6452_19037 [Arctium lappa]|uniref:Uncharacterized protein n=1 Tax=Arctium lappa TaxID=4217 RepID=A0ACB9BBX5_ARCLA|nr:hypothetical protein L6452_19037 [Arctium lappa]